MIILTLNCGSSSVKYSVFNTAHGTMLARGIVERVGLTGSFISHTVGTHEVKIEIKCLNHKVAIEHVLKLLVSSSDGILENITEVNAVGHRVVHGGEFFIESTIINEEVEDVIAELSTLAPLHNPANLQGIQAARDVLPKIPHVAVFDTAFHQTLPEYAFRYAIPSRWYDEKKIRKYGFHGTSHFYVSQRAMQLLGDSMKKSRIISLHLGNGVSITAIKDGKSIDTSMGLTPLEGLIMGTRSGDLDPGVILYMMRSENLSPEELDAILNRKSGLIGITTTSDMRDIEKKATEGDEKSHLALKMAVYRVQKYIGAYTVALGGLNAIIFTAGIGENSPTFRNHVLKDLEFLGIKLDEKANKKAIGGKEDQIISADSSDVKILVIPTNEELVMAQDVENVILRRNIKIP
ncbi:MAG: acetate kinase [Candidatus Heimdallarchaeota archaeon]|nr:MAG: acetate kinase [Candidatus Heimdallarchaeota archaeon]